MQKKYYWLKLPISFFSDPRIKKLRRIAGGDTYVIIFLKIMLTVINSEGIYTYEGIEKTLEEELALKLDEDVDNIKVVIAFLSTNQEFIELTNENYLIQRVTSLIGKETDSAIRKRKQRQKEKESNVTMSHDSRNNVPLDKELDKDIKPSLLLSPKNETQNDFKTFKNHLINICPTFQFSLQGKFGYNDEHQGFCIKGGYIFDLHTNKLLDKDASFIIWEYLFQQKTKVLEIAKSQYQQMTYTKKIEK